jgi:serine/threonine-protein kinase
VQAERWSEIDALFAAALEVPPDERRIFLDDACADDADLRGAVERLLAADVAARTFLERPARLTEAGGEEAPLAADARFGPYRLERLLGRGGMGTVYLATRDDGQFERRVALKLLRRGAGDADALQRFRAERQILARLEHPSIARLYDGGETAHGLPFLVMEYVEGLPLDAYCDRNRLGLRERLALFRRLLDAVAYAHQNLLVHRDIKPANVLVTAEGEPKLLDFGIAARLAADGSAALTRRRPMTPAFASPEQVRGAAVSTASDVYALGVVLYELLCGRPPYRLESDLPYELDAAILAQEVERPSQALDRPARPGEPSREEIAAARRARPRELCRALRGDLDTIVLTALRKEPERRYGSVVELAADVDRYLAALPVSARPDTLGYRAGKFARRHRAGVALAGVALALIAALFVSLLQQRDRATRERDKARQALAFLVDVFERADPFAKGAARVSARELLDTGARRAARELGGDPEVQAALLDAIGQASLGLGQVAEAAPLLERAVAVRRATAPGSPELADSLEHLAWLELHRSGYDAAEALLREAIALRRRLAGGRDSPQVAAALNRLGNVLFERHQASDEAHTREIEGLHQEALAIYRRREGPDGPGVAASLERLAMAAKGRGDLAQSERLGRQALRIRRARAREDDPETATSLRSLAQTLVEESKFDEARGLLGQALAVQRRVLPAGHPELMLTTNDLALVHSRRGDYAAAEPLYRQVLAFELATFGERHAASAIVLGNLAGSLQNQGKLEEAAALHERALAAKLAVYGERHIFVAQTLGSLARLRSELGRHAAALELARRSLAINRELLEPGHPELAWPLRTMGIVLLDGGDAAQAEPYLRQSLELLRKTQPAGYFQTAKVEVLLGACLAQLGRAAEGEPLMRHGLAVLEGQFAADHPAVVEARERLGTVTRD